MANTFVNKKADLTSTSATTLYTVPSATTAVVKSILVSEDSGNADTITVTITDTSDAVFSLFKTKGADNNSVVALADIALVLNRLKTASDVSVIVTVIVSALPESSDTSIDFITAVVADGTVYNVVALLLVKSAFLFTKLFAIRI